MEFVTCGMGYRIHRWGFPSHSNYYDIPKFPGHCWSNESHYFPLGLSNSESRTTLHPSFRPKCTHAYALSHSGARRLLLHLRYPPFSYSRALDQALSWLIQSGRLRAYSVVPSLVVQRKSAWSDIMIGNEGMGSEWKEKLEKSVLGPWRCQDHSWLVVLLVVLCDLACAIQIIIIG